MTEEEKKKLNADVDREKTELEKYIYFFERYHNHDGGLKVAQEMSKNMISKMQELHDTYHLEHGEVQFLDVAGKTLVECKRVLKWSYGFGYYLDPKRREFYEFSQKDLEKYTDELLESLEMHYKTEVRMELGKLDLPKFTRYKNEVISLKDKCETFLEGFLGQIDQEWLEKVK
jgi:ariadne-1